MTPQEIELVRSSFRKVAPISDHIVALFYARLFELDPSLRCQCRGGMEEQGRRLVRMMSGLLGWLEHGDDLLRTLRRFGARQAHRGLRDEHYAFVGTALIWSLEKALGPEFSIPLKSAWTRFYVELASATLDGAHAHELAA